MNRVCILVTGPNCSGKTTATTNVRGQFRDSDDIEWIYADNDDRFKGSAESQEAAVENIWLLGPAIIVFEGTRINTPLIRVAKKYPESWRTAIGTTSPVLGRKLEVFMTKQTPDIMLAHLKARCEKRGKTFRADYWDNKKLTYEGSGRYPNKFAKEYIKPRVYNIDLEYAILGQMATDIEAAIKAAL